MSNASGSQQFFQKEYGVLTSVGLWLILRKGLITVDLYVKHTNGQSGTNGGTNVSLDILCLGKTERTRIKGTLRMHMDCVNGTNVT
jgi:hypothetical protein